jgi:hypothetical protein
MKCKEKVLPNSFTPRLFPRHAPVLYSREQTEKEQRRAGLGHQARPSAAGRGSGPGNSQRDKAGRAERHLIG